MKVEITRHEKLTFKGESKITGGAYHAWYDGEHKELTANLYGQMITLAVVDAEELFSFLHKVGKAVQGE